MKIIILIIASDEQPVYIQMQNIWKKYMNLNPNILSYFIKFKNMNNPIEIIEIDDLNNTIWVNGNESYIPGILDKTIKVIKFLLKTQTFDFIYRTNLSSFLNLDRLYNYIIKNNHINYAGPRDPTFISGSGFFLSLKACNYLSTSTDLDYVSDVG